MTRNSLTGPEWLEAMRLFAAIGDRDIGMRVLGFCYSLLDQLEQRWPEMTACRITTLTPEKVHTLSEHFRQQLEEQLKQS